jgi:hypothetical protein
MQDRATDCLANGIWLHAQPLRNLGVREIAPIAQVKHELISLRELGEGLEQLGALGVVSSDGRLSPPKALA